LGVRITHWRVARQKRWGLSTMAISRPGLEVGCHGPSAWHNVRTRPLWLILATT
jgi:hypothetical protein